MVVSELDTPLAYPVIGKVFDYEEEPRRVFTEADLFKKGRLNLADADFDAVIAGRLDDARATHHYQSVWDSRQAYIQKGATASALREDIKLEQFLLQARMKGEEQSAWLQEYNGVVPVSWGNMRDLRNGVLGDFQRAAEAGIQLSSTLIDAGVDHPHASVIEETFSTQRLDVPQLTKVFRRFPKIVPGRRYLWVTNITNSQAEKGVSRKEMLEAYRIAHPL